MIRKHTNILQSEINQNLRPDPALVLHHALPRRLAVELSAGVQVNLRQSPRLVRLLNTKTAAGVMQVQENASAFFRNRIQRTRYQF